MLEKVEKRTYWRWWRVNDEVRGIRTYTGLILIWDTSNWNEHRITTKFTTSPPHPSIWKAVGLCCVWHSAMELLGLTRFRSRNCITNTSPILYICHKKKITHTNISVCIIREVRQHSLLSELRVPSHISSSATLSCNIGIRVLGAVVTYYSSPPASIY